LTPAVLGPLLGAALLLTAGCAGTQQTPLPGGFQTSLSRPMSGTTGASSPEAGAPKSSVLYVSNWYGMDVEVYSAKKHKLLRSIDTSPYSPNSVRVDGSGNLWVALNTYGTQPRLWVYKPGASMPFRTLNGISTTPTGVAIGRDGTAYVTDEGSTPANIWVFAPGSSQPTSKLTDPNGTCCGWVAVDQHNNVFFTYESQSGHTGAIDEFVHGSSTPKSLGITLTTFPGGIEVLDNDTIIVTEQGITSFSLAPTIDTFPKGATKPSSVISGDPNCDEWVGPALNRNKNRIYVGTLFTSVSCYVNGTPAAIKEYTYPGGRLVDEFNTGMTDQSGWTLLVPAIDPPVAGQ
jgi:hypothetical protein